MNLIILNSAYIKISWVWQRVIYPTTKIWEKDMVKYGFGHCANHQLGFYVLQIRILIW